MTLTVLYVKVTDVHPNRWNPNKQDEFIFEKEKASIARYGFVSPIVARKAAAGYEIIDGEHRLRAATALGHTVVPLVDIGPIDDDDAKALTIILNETKGVAQPDLLRPLLEDLAKRHPVDDLLSVLPYTTEQFSSLIGTVDWSKLPTEMPKFKQDRERWVMRSYRMPEDAALILDSAIEKAQDDSPCPDWQALERIAAEFIS